MDLVAIVLLIVIVIVAYQLFLAATQGRIYGKNNWFTYSAGWIYAKQKPNMFKMMVTTYSIGLFGAILVLVLEVF